MLRAPSEHVCLEDPEAALRTEVFWLTIRSASARLHVAQPVFLLSLSSVHCLVPDLLAYLAKELKLSYVRWARQSSEMLHTDCLTAAFRVGGRVNKQEAGFNFLFQHLFGG